MKSHCVIFFVLFVGIWAAPASQEDELSMYFRHGDTKIIGGSPAPIGSVPYMAILTKGGTVRSLTCGGSIISQRTILTAAHCVIGLIEYTGVILNTTLITVGTNTLTTSGQSYEILNHAVHDNYSSLDLKHDIGLLITNETIVLSATVQPVPLSFEYIPQEVEAKAAGFGYISLRGPSEVLLELIVKTIDGQECVDIVEAAKIELNHIWAPSTDPELEICTFHSTGHGMCIGDSGSALVQVSNGRQIGLVSWGLPCALGAPDMFVRVSLYSEWILTNGL